LALRLHSTASAPPRPNLPSRPFPKTSKTSPKTILGREARVLAYGDLAKTGKQQVLAANVVPKPRRTRFLAPSSRAPVVVENTDGKWTEILRADEHLKNARGFLALSPRESNFRLASAMGAKPGESLQLYFTPVKGISDPHVLP